MSGLCMGRFYATAAKLIASSLVVWLISSCSSPSVTNSTPTNSTPAGGNNTKPNSSLVDGTWYGACETASADAQASEQTTHVILGSTITSSTLQYSDPQCKTVISSAVVSASFKLGNPSSSAPGAYELQLTPTKVLETLKTADGVNQANNGLTIPLDPPVVLPPTCGAGFTIDVAKELTAELCKNDEIYSKIFLSSYGLVKIDGDRLYFGHFEETRDGSTPDKRPTSLETKYLSKISPANAGLCEPADQIPQESCTAAIPYSTTAFRSKSCSADGQSYIYGTCEASACASGYSVSPTTKTCVAFIACTPNAQLGTVSCVADSPNSTTATKSQSCSANGQSYVYGTCEASACASGYSVSTTTKTCVANTLCTPNAQLGTVSCVADSPNSTTATKSQSCSANGQSYIYGACSLSTCKSGFIVQGNVCSSTVEIKKAAFALYNNGTAVSQNLTVNAGSTTKISIGRDIQYIYGSTTYGDGWTSYGVPIVTGSHTDYSWSSSPGAGALSRTGLYDGYSYNFIAPNQAGTYTITVTLTKSWSASSVDITDAVKAAAGAQFTAQFTVVVQ